MAAPDLTEFLMPNVPGLSDTPDQEIGNIRAFLQLSAVKFNTLAHLTAGKLSEHTTELAQATQDSQNAALHAKAPNRTCSWSRTSWARRPRTQPTRFR